MIAKHIRLRRPDRAEALSYNAVQRATYLIVIFLLFPLVILTGLALSPGFNAAFPLVVNSLGGRQSARTLHFFITISLLIFLIIHVAMIFLTGFMSRMRAMTTGHVEAACVGADAFVRPAMRSERPGSAAEASICTGQSGMTSEEMMSKETTSNGMITPKKPLPEQPSPFASHLIEERP